MNKNFQTIFASLELALEKATEFARTHRDDVFITYTRYGRPDDPKYEFRYRLRSDIIGEPLNVCYICSPNGVNIQINTHPYEMDKRTK